jgi:hypothetical protein
LKLFFKDIDFILYVSFKFLLNFSLFFFRYSASSSVLNFLDRNILFSFIYVSFAHIFRHILLQFLFIAKFIKDPIKISE